MPRVPARGPTAEERIEELLAERRRELETQAARFEESVRDLERREELLRDSRASLERLLRLGTSDLDSREAELAQLIRELTAREERLREEEAELARRRVELGAVELKRATLERDERLLTEREEKVSAREAQLARRSTGADGDVPRVAFVPGPAYRLVEIEPAELGEGGVLELDGDEYAVARIGPSPLPRDSRRCAYLVQGPGGGSASSDGSGSS